MAARSPSTITPATCSIRAGWSSNTPLAAVALGSNLGDRESHLAFATDRLRSVLHDLRHSQWYDTAPVGVGDQPRFLNGVAVGETTLSARELLRTLLDIEADRGRARPYWGAARTLDLDLVFYGNERISEEGLEVPHPRFRERLFVLEPLAELEPGWIDPVTGSTISALLLSARRRTPAS